LFAPLGAVTVGFVGTGAYSLDALMGFALPEQVP
jgi:hypothetical protein